MVPTGNSTVRTTMAAGRSRCASSGGEKAATPPAGSRRSVTTGTPGRRTGPWNSCGRSTSHFISMDGDAARECQMPCQLEASRLGEPPDQRHAGAKDHRVDLEDELIDLLLDRTCQ